MAELTPWRVRCTVLSVGYNVGIALLGGTTPMVATWLLARTGHQMAPAVYLAATASLAFLGAILLPPAARHGSGASGAAGGRTGGKGGGGR